MAKEQTPIDPISGLPLLLAPDDRIPLILDGALPRRVDDRPVADWNHVYHPAKEVFKSGFGGEAVRCVRLQYVLRQEQHDEYHAQFDGPPLPKNPEERFKAVVLSAAGYIPPAAIDFNRRGFRLVSLEGDVRQRLMSSNEVRVASYSAVQKFLRTYVMQESVDHILPATVDRFLTLGNMDNASDQRERIYLAHLLLSLVIDRSGEPVEHPYAFGRRHGLIDAGMPARPRDFVRSLIIRGKKGVRGVTKSLHHRLLEHRDGPEAVARLGGMAIAGIHR